MIYGERKTKKELLAGLTDIRMSRLVGNNTVEVTFNDGSRIVKFHDTIIITFKKGSVTLNTDGYRTQTTRDRINAYRAETKVTVYQEKGLWYAHSSTGAEDYTWRGETDPVFYDGMTFKAGMLTSGIREPNMKAVSALKKNIEAFVKLVDTKLPEPNDTAGDCWYCSLHEVDTGKTLGDVTESDHLKLHMEEGYLPLSMVINAMREAGFRDEQIYLHVAGKWTDNIKRYLRRYLEKRLIPAVVPN